MKSLLITALLLAGVNSSAASFKIVKQNLSQGNYEAEVAYPVFADGSVPAAKKINAEIKEQILYGGCDAEESNEGEFGYSYDVRAGVVALNQNYIGLEIAYSDYCGGAHPNHGVYFITFDSRTGERVNFGKEIPSDDWSSPKNDKFRLKLAVLMLKNKEFMETVGEECVEGKTLREKAESLVSLSPSVAGLARDKKIIINTNPPHAAMPCQAEVRVDYKVLASEIAKGSKLHKWLK